jgi:O-antigen ligase
MALTACFLGAVFLADLRSRRALSLLGWFACLGITALTGSRMASFALLMQWAAYPLLDRDRRASAAASFASLRLLVPILVGLSLLFIPEFRGRFFAGDEETGSVQQLLGGEAPLSGTGRFEVWPLVWHEAKRHIAFGSGVGEMDKFVPLVWAGMSKTHNDYLRILFELGVAGLLLFLFAIVAQLLLLRRMIRSSSGEARRAFIAAYLGLVVLMVVSMTENTIVYGVWYMHPLFAVLGGAYGVGCLRAPMQRPRFVHPVADASREFWARSRTPTRVSVSR